MTVLLSHIRALIHTHPTAIRCLFIQVALVLCASMALAGEIKELSVTENDGEYRLRIVSVLNAPPDYVHDVITDFEHGYRVNPSIVEAEILPTERDGVIRLRNHSEHRVGPFFFSIDWVGDIVELDDGSIKATTLPEFSSFESGTSTWELRSIGEQRTWLLHDLSLTPDFFIPPIIGPQLMKKYMEKDALASFNRIECQAMIRLERGFENDTGPLTARLKEGKQCINSRG